MKWRIVRRRKRRRNSSITVHYTAHKESARKLVHEKLQYWNQFYNFSYKRVSIRNTRTCWGSCTSLKNLNFSYRVLFLPPSLQDYIIVHELCHLEQLNHSQAFWDLVAIQLPEHKALRSELKSIELQGSRALGSGAGLKR